MFNQILNGALQVISFFFCPGPAHWVQRILGYKDPEPESVVWLVLCKKEMRAVVEVFLLWWSFYVQVWRVIHTLIGRNKIRIDFFEPATKLLCIFDNLIPILEFAVPFLCLVLASQTTAVPVSRRPQSAIYQFIRCQQLHRQQRYLLAEHWCSRSMPVCSWAPQSRLRPWLLPPESANSSRQERIRFLTGVRPRKALIRACSVIYHVPPVRCIGVLGRMDPGAWENPNWRNKEPGVGSHAKRRGWVNLCNETETEKVAFFGGNLNIFSTFSTIISCKKCYKTKYAIGNFSFVLFLI